MMVNDDDDGGKKSWLMYIIRLSKLMVVNDG